MAGASLDSLMMSFNVQLEAVLRSACDEGEGWGELLRRCGLPLRPGPSAPGPARGEELKAVLAALVAEAAGVVDQLGARPDIDAERVRGIRLRLARIVEHETGRYLRAVAAAGQPKRASGIAAIFQNAVETARLSPWANLKWDRRLTVTCRTCGAPQLTRREFRCEFCGSDMFNPSGGDR